nr:nucleotide disphospho-sugar-binding domain-containing protein [Kibdelosporangium sp. MJ126-NF4]
MTPADREELLNTAYGQPPWPPSWPVRPNQLTPQQIHYLAVLGRYTVAVAEAMASDLVAFAKHWRPDLIVHDTLALGARIAATLTNVPCVRYTHGTQDVFRVERYASTEHTALFQRFGLEVPTKTPNYVDTMPPSMFIGAERPCLSMRWIVHNGPGAAPRLPTKRPRVCVTWGVVSSALGTAAGNPYRQAIEAIAAAGADILVLTAADQIPLNLVLPYCDVIVHHGGEGTGMTAAALATTQLVITREPLDDQFGGRLARTGAAIHLTDNKNTADAIEKLLTDPSHQEAADRLREDIESQPTPLEVVKSLMARC